MKPTSEAAFETAIEAVLLGAGYSRRDGKGLGRERVIFPGEALAYIQTTQAKVLGEAGGPARWADRRAGAGGPVQVARHPWHA